MFAVEVWRYLERMVPTGQREMTEKIEETRRKIVVQDNCGSPRRDRFAERGLGGRHTRHAA